MSPNLESNPEELVKDLRIYHNLRLDRREFYKGSGEYNHFIAKLSRTPLDRFYDKAYLAEDKNPDRIIPVPYALIKESKDNLVETLDRLYTETEESEGAVAEVLIYTNTKTPGYMSQSIHITENAASIQEAEEDYLQLKQHIPAYPPDKFRINMAKDFMHPHENFNHLRSRLMNYIIGEAVGRNISPNIPIMPEDADRRDIDRGRPPIELLIDDLRSGQAHLAKANLVLMSKEKNDNPKTLEDHEKIAVVYSMAKQICNKNSDPFNYPYYVDESGSAFTLKTYLRAGGYGLTNDQYGENRTLILGIEAAKRNGLLDPNIPTVKYNHDARIGNDDRRFRQLAKYLPMSELAESEAGYGYVDFTSLEKSGAENKIVEADAYFIIRYMFRNHELKTKKAIPYEDTVALWSLVKSLDFKNKYAN